MKPRLISFKLCPFVQRSVITLLEKGVEFEIDYIDLQEPPEWFTAISPLGKVPVLEVGETVLFESAVINEYLDETHPPSMLPSDPLRRAHNRAWIAFGSELLFAQYHLSMAASEEEFDRHYDSFRRGLRQIEGQLGHAEPYFNGRSFGLIDAAWAPLFQRLDLLESWHPLELTRSLPAVADWQDALLDRPSTQASMADGFDTLLRSHIVRADGYAARLFADPPAESRPG